MIIYRNNITRFEQDQIPELINKAQEFLRTVYPDANFENVDFIFSKGKRSRYFRNEIKDGKYLSPTVYICNRSMLYLYNKKSLGLKRHSLQVGGLLQMTLALIHELTHHIQWNEKRSRGELETTRNEVEYLRIYYPNYYKMLYA